MIERPCEVRYPQERNCKLHLHWRGSATGGRNVFLGLLEIIAGISTVNSAVSRSSHGFHLFMDLLTTTTRFHPAGSLRPTPLSSFTLFPVFHSSSFHI